LDIFVREGRTLDHSIERSLQPGRLNLTNVVIKTGDDCVTLVSRRTDNLWLGAKACCPDCRPKEKQRVLACEECHLASKSPKLLIPQVLGDFYDTYARPEAKPIGAWYMLTSGAYSELPIWSNDAIVTGSPPSVRQKKRRRSEVD
jgi:hypothetical protein